ncbi:DUF397 domain-containing protein [Streptomyces litchfieldiae]|uniref:DUF397 domain-containing protein n=1 Tax=Streptomyces litchfieldiae TaxID=3075543 RepID=A0ABU2MU38_9ACTN|nr:DUF397 domain-containing protein [Streptomyces sp. DSM 44938]MDT0345156.1 DUF397 domain-containing protein [Streptomyces sp. DSM 44938]
MSTHPTDALDWFKSSYSGNGGQCVEVARGLVGAVPVRDSKIADGPHLVVSADAWAAFVNGIK